MLVFRMIWTVGAAVYAVIRQIQWCEHHDAVAVDILLDPLSQRIDFLNLFRHIAGQKNGCFAMREPLLSFRLFDDGIDQPEVVPVP